MHGSAAMNSDRKVREAIREIDRKLSAELRANNPTRWWLERVQRIATRLATGVFVVGIAIAITEIWIPDIWDLPVFRHFGQVFLVVFGGGLVLAFMLELWIDRLRKEDAAARLKEHARDQD